jgi:hypothetical protein
MKPHPRARVILGVLLVWLSAPLSIVIVFKHPGATSVDTLFVFGICSLPVVCLVLPMMVSNRYTQRPRTFANLVSSVFVTIELATYLGWIPFFPEICGAPIAGFACFEAGAALFGILAGLTLRQMFVVLEEPINLCWNCGYDRTGLPAGAVCPECGSKWGPA